MASVSNNGIRFRLKPDTSNSHEFELHRPSNKGTRLLLKVIKAIIIIRRPAPSWSKCAKTLVRKASPDKTGTEQGKRAKCDGSDGKCERKRENIQHPRKPVKTPKMQDDIRHVFSDPAHGSRVRLSAASLTNPCQALILQQKVDHDPMPMDAYKGSSEQSR